MSEELVTRRLKPGVTFTPKREPGSSERKRITGPANVQLTKIQEERFEDLLEPKGHELIGMDAKPAIEPVQSVNQSVQSPASNAPSTPGTTTSSGEGGSASSTPITSPNGGASVPANVAPATPKA